MTTTDSLSPDSRYGNVVVVAAELIGPVGARTTEWTFPSWHLSIKISWTGGTESRMQVTQQIKGFECLPKYTTKKTKSSLHPSTIQRLPDVFNHRPITANRRKIKYILHYFAKRSSLFAKCAVLAFSIYIFLNGCCFIDTAANIVCEAGSMQRASVRLSVRLFVPSSDNSNGRPQVCC